MPPKASPFVQRIDGICREAERRIITGVPTSSWYALQERRLAPRPTRLSPRSVGWSRQELFDWCERRLAERDAGWQQLGAVAARVVEKVKS
jgi:predicted DNA-binding transcriptional regulator AlpA